MDARSSAPVVAVVEDDSACRTALGRLLRAEGFETALFESAEAYIEHPPAPSPICVIVDVQLPGMSGIDLQRRLRADHDAPPVIVTTGNRDGGIREHAERNGCAGFFWKPVDGDALLAAIAVLAHHLA
jgi:FixJ family two-component response regulator